MPSNTGDGNPLYKCAEVASNTTSSRSHCIPSVRCAGLSDAVIKLFHRSHHSNKNYGKQWITNKRQNNEQPYSINKVVSLICG